MTLHELVEAGDMSAVRAAAAEGSDFNRSFPDSDESLLTTAVAKGHLAMARLLLELGADPNIRETVTPPLAAAAAKGSQELVTTLVTAGAAVDVRDEDGWTPLMIAAAYGHVEVVRELLRQGANPKLKNRHGNSALTVAVDKKHVNIYELLMPLSTSQEREKARITLQIQSQAVDDERVVRLIHHAATRGVFEEVRNVIDKDRLEADVIDRNGTTALMMAANKNHIEIVRWLLDRGADVNRRDIYGECPLTYAAMGCHPEMYDFLYPLTDKKLRKRAEKIKQNQIDIGNWPTN
jgi:ankyrin repeat protein